MSAQLLESNGKIDKNQFHELANRSWHALILPIRWLRMKYEIYEKRFYRPKQIDLGRIASFLFRNYWSELV